MATHLRLHHELAASWGADTPATYRFPAAMAAARRTLVGAVVRGPATPGAPERGWSGAGSGASTAVCGGVIAHIEGGRDRTTPTERLMRDVERTLDHMQGKLDALHEDVDDVLKFPAPQDDGRPWAA